jgi:hypothetical protein
MLALSNFSTAMGKFLVGKYITMYHNINSRNEDHDFKIFSQKKWGENGVFVQNTAIFSKIGSYITLVFKKQRQFSRRK